MPDTELQLLPKPPRPGLYVVQGDEWLIPYALQRITLTYAGASRIVWIDAANRFNAHWVAISARSIYKDVNLAVRSYSVARPFTAYQLEAMVTEKLLPAVTRSGALFSVIADPLWLYQEAEGRDTQVEQSFQRFLKGLRAATKQTPVLILACQALHSRWFGPVVQGAAQVLTFNLNSTGHQLAWVGR